MSDPSLDIVREALREDAKLICEAGTVYHETGLTPRQLLEQREEAVKALIPFAKLLQEHNKEGRLSDPVFGVNDAKITRGDLIAAKNFLAKTTGTK